ncbi:MAG: glutathione S-transferase N-terminal domain-containing protein [Dehalococcoidales bacterium]|nr:glutathione S-transferase N-terminal domain-containing protein [Dehalococcoidales bacterium]
MAVKQVRVYSTTTCPWCKKTRQFLDQNGILYEDFNVTENKAAMEEMVKISHQMAVPTISIDGEFIIGYNETALKEKLGL